MTTRSVQRPPARGARVAACLIWLGPMLLALGWSADRLFGERWESDAPYYQAIALKAAREGHWWTLMEANVPYFNKPPGMFWVHALCVRAFGETDWAARLPEWLCFGAVCGLVAALGRRLLSPVAGLGAGVAMALAEDWVWRVSTFRLEMSQTAAMLGAVWCWCIAFDLRAGGGGERGDGGTDSLRWCVAAGACVGVAAMIKPLVALALPVWALLWVASSGVLRVRRAALLGVSLLTALVVVFPWHAWMLVQHGDAFVGAYFKDQVVERATGLKYDAEPWWWYFKHMAGLTPDSVRPERMYAFYLAGIAGWAWAIAGGRRPERRTGGMLSITWTAAWLIALAAFADKRNYYILPVHPGVALGCGMLASRVMELVLRGSEALWWRAAGAGACAVGIGLLMLHCAKREETRSRLVLSPGRAAMVECVRAHTGREMYNAGLYYPEAGLVYIKTGKWARVIGEKRPVPWEEIPVGALALVRVDGQASSSVDFGVYGRVLCSVRDRLGEYVVVERGRGSAGVVQAVVVLR